MKSLHALLFSALVSLPTFAAAKVATAAADITVPAGFKVDLVRSAEPTEGTWICMAKDNKGRLIISPQDPKLPLLRLTTSPDGAIDKIEKIELPIGEAMGLLYAFDSLYVSGRGGERRDVFGLYRLRDTNGDDQYDSVELLKKFDGAGGEHGSHALALGPDNHLYYINGNFVKVPSDISANSPHRNFQDDVLLPRGEDGNGFGRGMKPPGGFILRADKDGKNWDLYAAGMRNTYDFAFNADGEILCFDSDMEWDWSMPWYRPTRIYHLVSGGDYGFREGTAKWPAYYEDALPPVLDIGVGSPTGVTFGYGAKFPAKYQNALYAMVWSYGRIFAVHLTPQSASYSATKEDFVRAKPTKPLNVTDMVVGNDGALWFATGGRGTQSGLYRVTYTGSDSTAPADAKDNSQAQARALRHKLEAFHGKKDSSALDVIWPNLGSSDRSIRYAARIALESQDLETWQTRALSEDNTDTALTALLALARLGKKDVQADLVGCLARLGKTPFNAAQTMQALRILEVSMARMGRPDEELTARIGAAINKRFPSPDPLLNRELAQIAIYTQAPDVVEKCLALVKSSPNFEDQMFYMFHLRNLKTGWTKAQREEYFAWWNAKHEGRNSQHPVQTVAWFTDAGRDYSDGASFPKFIANAKADAVASLTDAERGELAAAITGEQPKPKAIPTVARAFVKQWKTSDLADSLDQVSKGRDFKRGQQAFTDAQCLACHRFGNEGGSTGPEITTVSSRFTRRDILESILEPSKVISDQFASTEFVLKNGDEVTGRILEENDQRYVVLINGLTNAKAEVKKSDVAKKTISKTSMMPEGLAAILTKDEILDLLAYIESAGKQTSPLFQR